MQKYRIRYRVPWYQAVNWNVAIKWACWFALGAAIGAIATVIWFGSFLRQVFG